MWVATEAATVNIWLWPAMLLLLATSASADKKSNGRCPKGQVLDLNAKCVKRFVLPAREPCPELELRFGRAEAAIGGRMVRFACEDGWSLAPPNEYAMCKLGHWDREVPRCLRPGCRSLKAPEGVLQWLEMDGAVARFSCVGGGNAVLEGQPVLGCDGEFWNGTAPRCVERKTVAAMEAEPTELTAESNHDASTSEAVKTRNPMPLLTPLLLLVTLASV